MEGVVGSSVEKQTIDFFVSNILENNLMMIKALKESKNPRDLEKADAMSIALKEGFPFGVYAVVKDGDKLHVLKYITPQSESYAPSH